MPLVHSPADALASQSASWSSQPLSRLRLKSSALRATPGWPSLQSVHECAHSVSMKPAFFSHSPSAAQSEHSSRVSAHPLAAVGFWYRLGNAKTEARAQHTIQQRHRIGSTEQRKQGTGVK